MFVLDLIFPASEGQIRSIKWKVTEFCLSAWHYAIPCNILHACPKWQNPSWHGDWRSKHINWKWISRILLTPLNPLTWPSSLCLHSCNSVFRVPTLFKSSSFCNLSWAMASLSTCQGQLTQHCWERHSQLQNILYPDVTLHSFHWRWGGHLRTIWGSSSKKPRSRQYNKESTPRIEIANWAVSKLSYEFFTERSLSIRMLFSIIRSGSTLWQTNRSPVNPNSDLEALLSLIFFIIHKHKHIQNPGRCRTAIKRHAEWPSSTSR